MQPLKFLGVFFSVGGFLSLFISWLEIFLMLKNICEVIWIYEFE